MKDLDNHKKVTVLLDADNALRKPLLQRAIGIIYRLETKRQNHYLYVDIRARFDVAAHLDETTELKALVPPRAGTSRGFQRAYRSPF